MAEAAGTPPKKSSITPIQWLICAVAAVGFAFDIYAVLVLPLIVRPAVMSMGGLKAGAPAFNKLLNEWVGLLFFLPALAGGGFCVGGGYLARIFRRNGILW